MKLIKDDIFRYNTRVNNVLRMDVQMGLHTDWKSDVSGMCREMLDCMLTYFPKIHYVQIKESEENTEAYFNETPELICTDEEMYRYMRYPDGWHVVNINTTEMNEFNNLIQEITSNDILYKDTILEQYQNDRKRLSKVLYQYGLMHVFYHEYGHAMDGHILAEKNGKIGNTSQISKALEYNADLFAVNQMCRRFYFDNLNEICIGNNKITIAPIREEMALMALSVYIFLDSKYNRDRSDSFYEEIEKSTSHLAPFLRQYYIACQFAGIWKNIINLSEENIKEFSQEVIWYLDAYERARYGKPLRESPFFIGEITPEISKAQSCWNDIYEKLLPYTSPNVGIGKLSVYNVLTKSFE